MITPRISVEVSLLREEQGAISAAESGIAQESESFYVFFGLCGRVESD
jgi:hypothetical protein